VQGCTTAHAANQIADKLVEEEHPIWGHRSLLIQKSFVAQGWVTDLKA
jgi:hypothetical protein